MPSAHHFPFIDDGTNEFIVSTRSGFHLSCQLDLPSTSREHSTQPKLGVLCPGLYQTRQSKTIVEASKALLKHPSTLDGIIRFEFHGEGKSDGFEQWSFGGYEDELEDLRDIIEFLKYNHCDVHLVLGHSRGATVVVLYAEKYGDIPLVVSVAGRFHMECGIDAHIYGENKRLIDQDQTIIIKDNKGKPRKVTPDCIKRRIALDIKNKAEQICDSPKQIEAFCIIHGDLDDIIPRSDAEELYLILKERMKTEGKKFDVQFRPIEETGHDIGTSPNLNEFHLALRYLVECHPPK